MISEGWVRVSRQLGVLGVCAMAAAACGGAGADRSDTALASDSASNGMSSTTAAAPPSVRGTVASISPTSVVVKTDTGNVTVKLTQPLKVYDRQPAKLTDVKDNSFIGVTTVKQPNGAERATEIHIFPEELRGMGEGSRMMAQSGAGGGSGNRMTNGAVAPSRMTNGTASQSRMSNGSVANASDSTLVVQYSGGSTTVTVPRNTPVTELKATSRSLKAGDRVVVPVSREADGSLSSDKVLMSRR